MRAIAHAVIAFLFLTANAFAQTLMVNGGANLNIRTGPGTSFPVMAQAQGGEVLEQRGRSGDWVLTTQGWIHSDFVHRLDRFIAPQAPEVTIGLAGGQSSAVTQAALSPNGAILGTRAGDIDLLQFWNYQTGELLGSYTHASDFSEEEEPYLSVTFLSNDRFAVHTLNDHMIVVDLASLTQIYSGAALRGTVVRVDEDHIVTHHNSEFFYYSPIDLGILRSGDLLHKSEFGNRLDLYEGRISLPEYNLAETLRGALQIGILGHDFEGGAGNHLMYARTYTNGAHHLSVFNADGDLVSTAPLGDMNYQRVFPQLGVAHGYRSGDSTNQYGIFEIATGELMEDWSDITRETAYGFDPWFIPTHDRHAYQVTPDGRYYMRVRPTTANQSNSILELRDLVTRDTREFTLPRTFDRIAASHAPDAGSIVLSGRHSAYSFERDNRSQYQLWKIDIETLFASGGSDTLLNDAHPAITTFRPGMVEYRPIQYVAEDDGGRLRMVSPDQQIVWFDYDTIAATSVPLDGFTGALFYYRAEDGAAHYIRGAGNVFSASSEERPRAVSVLQGGTAPAYLFADLALETRGGDGPDVIATRLGRDRWNLAFQASIPWGQSGSSTRTYNVGGPEILLAADGGALALSVQTHDLSYIGVADVVVTSSGQWPKWAPLESIQAVTRRSSVFQGAWNRSRDGSAFIAVDDDERPGVYFIDDELFVPFDKAAYTWLSEKISRSDHIPSRLGFDFGFVFMGDGAVLALAPERACTPPLHISARTGESRTLEGLRPGRSFCKEFMGYSLSEALDHRRVVTLDGIVVDIETGEHLVTLPAARSYTASLDGRHIYLTRDSGTVTIADSTTAAEIATFYAMTDGSWVAMTPQGFYASGNDGDMHLRVAQGLAGSFSIDKFRDTLYRPDLVAEALRGDPEQLLLRAAREIDLERILLSGAAPLIEINGFQDGAIYSATASLTDQGGGIGRLEWRVNGVVQHSTEGLDAFSADLFLAEGENRIVLVAYNGENTIQGRSATITVSAQIEELGQPRLYILALGVDDYALDALTLRYAANDATTLAHEFARAGEGLYSEIFTHLLIDHEVTRENLDAVFRSLAGTVRPNDVFVFFSAGHGKTLDGRYFFIPQDFTGTTISSIRDEGIGHAQWQEWFSMIPAQKSLLLFDTCESGSLAESLVGRDLRFRSAVDFLGNATGRALMSASSSTELAWEGYEGHGVFTYSVLQALQTADLDGDGLIDIDEIAAVIQETVPAIAAQVWNERQTPQFKAPEVSFPVALPLLAELPRQ